MSRHAHFVQRHRKQSVLLQRMFATALKSHRAGGLEEAEALYRRILAIDAEHAGSLHLLGLIEKEHGNFENAIALIGKAITLDGTRALAPNYAAALSPDNPHAQNNLGVALEGLGRLNEAATAMRTYAKPLWNGEPLDGPLLIWGEQGIGDEVMFAGLAPQVANRGIHCLLDCDARLKPLFARSFPDMRVLERAPREDEFAAHIPSGNLACLFPPDATPYLIADQRKTAELRHRYHNGKRVIGLAWYTNDGKTGAQRCVPLKELTPLFESPENSWVSLQYGNLEAVAPMLVDSSVDQFADLDLFAAQISAMDLVITIDNSTAHLAGALGVPVWVLLPFNPNFRWLQSGCASPWYQTARLFRQPAPGDWRSVIQDVRKALAVQG